MTIHGPMTHVEFAEACARFDVNAIKEGLAVRRERWGMNGVLLLVDGSMYSPSWRAMRGGAEVWNVSDVLIYDDTSGDPDRAFDLMSVYESTLDEGTEQLGAYWDDGCLWIGER